MVVWVASYIQDADSVNLFKNKYVKNDWTRKICELLEMLLLLEVYFCAKLTKLALGLTINVFLEFTVPVVYLALVGTC